MVSTAIMEPRRLSWRSVTDAMPTPRSRTIREALMLWLKVSRLSSMRRSHVCRSSIRYEGRAEFPILDSLRVTFENDLNFLFRKMVSNSMVKGIIASLVI
jgi:hypothetical protein